MRRSSSSRAASGSAKGAPRTSARAGPRHRPSASSQRRGRRSRVIPQALVASPLLEAREPTDVGLIGHDRQSVPGRHPLDQLDVADLAKCLPHTVDVDLEGAQGVARGLLSPQSVHEAIGGDHVRCGQGEHGEDDHADAAARGGRPDPPRPPPADRAAGTPRRQASGPTSRTKVSTRSRFGSAGLGVRADQQARSRFQRLHWGGVAHVDIRPVRRCHRAGNVTARPGGSIPVVDRSSTATPFRASRPMSGRDWGLIPTPTTSGRTTPTGPSASPPFASATPTSASRPVARR